MKNSILLYSIAFAMVQILFLYEVIGKQQLAKNNFPERQSAFFTTMTLKQGK